MKLHITEDGSMLHKRGERVLIKNLEEKLTDIPLLKVEEVILSGSVGLTGAIVQKMLEHNIPITYLSYYGEYRGRLVPKYNSGVKLRMKQFELANNQGIKLQLAKEIVTAKLKNMRTLILKNNKVNKKIAKVTKEIKKIIKKVPRAQDIAELRGYEGITAKYYFSIFSDLLKNNEFEFNGRNKRPPKDPINAMLSYGYTSLYRKVITAIYLARLDPYVSFYHSIEDNRESLALDLMEEFRQPIIDAVVKKLVNKRMVKKDGFIKKKKGIFMKKKVLNTFIAQFNKKLNDKITHPITNKTLTWEKIINQQAVLFKSAVVKKEKYHAMVVR